MSYNRYQQFNGYKPKKVYRKRFYKPQKLWRLGKVMRVEYLSNKRNGGGDGKSTVYYHDFETPVYLYGDERGREQLYIVGKKLKVNKSGIIN